MAAELFHQLPRVVANDLRDDPERLSLVCADLLTYAKAKADYSAQGSTAEGLMKLRQRWGAMMDTVERIDAELITGLDLSDDA